MDKDYNDFGGFYLETVYRSAEVDHKNFKKHSDYNLIEIIQVYSGNGIVLAGEKAIEIETGAVYIINGDYFHSIQPKNPNIYMRNKVIIDSEKFYEILELCKMQQVINELREQGGLFFTFSNDISQSIDNMFMIIVNAVKEKAEFGMLKFVQGLTALLDYVFNYNSGYVHTSNTMLKHVIDYIKANSGRKIVLDELCQELFISKSYLCHMFKKQTDMTVNEYIFQCKVSEAIKLLSYTDKNITDIAMDTGFESSSHFCQVFKRYMGMSPSAYRKKKVFHSN